MALSEVLNALYDSELNFALIAEWDNGLLVRLGDEMNGWDAETYVRTAEQAADWLDKNAKVLYPDPNMLSEGRSRPAERGRIGATLGKHEHDQKRHRSSSVFSGSEGTIYSKPVLQPIVHTWLRGHSFST